MFLVVLWVCPDAVGGDVSSIIDNVFLEFFSGLLLELFLEL